MVTFAVKIPTRMLTLQSFLTAEGGNLEKPIAIKQQGDSPLNCSLPLLPVSANFCLQVRFELYSPK